LSNTFDLKSAKLYKPGAYETFDDNLADILVDVLNGDEKLLEMPEIQSLGARNIKAALEWLATADVNGDYKDLLAKEGWRLMYRRRPPTPEEYLTWDWIGAQSEGLWPNVRHAFVEFMNLSPLNPKRGLALSTSIGWGKSLLTNLCMSYIITLFCLMREPFKVLGHSPMTSYCVSLCSYSLGKAWDLLGTPFEQFIEQSPMFEKVGRRDDVVNANKLDPNCTKIYYSTAGRGSARMIYRNNLQLKMMSTEGHLLGNAQPMYSKIMKADGSYYEMKDVKVGDKIASPTEGVTEVIGVFPQPKKRPIYEIELENGKKVRAADNHLWKVAIDKDETGNWNWQIVNTMQLKDWLEKGIDVEIYGEDNAPECKIPKNKTSEL